MVELGKVARRGFLAEQGGKFLGCPTGDCPMVYEVAKFEEKGIRTCNCCHKKHCLNCGVEYHEEMSCAEYQEWQKMMQKANEADEQFQKKMFQSGAYKRCPVESCKLDFFLFSFFLFVSFPSFSFLSFLFFLLFLYFFSFSSLSPLPLLLLSHSNFFFKVLCSKKIVVVIMLFVAFVKLLSVGPPARHELLVVEVTIATNLAFQQKKWSFNNNKKKS